MAYRITILTIGRVKESWLNEAIKEYTKRLSGAAEIVWKLARTEEELEALTLKEKGVICLDPKGKQLTSEEFSGYLLHELEERGSRVAFLIGGAEGISPTLKKNAPQIALSPMTFTHQMVRVILLEQIYRALEIAKGSHYHK